MRGWCAETTDAEGALSSRAATRWSFDFPFPGNLPEIPPNWLPKTVDDVFAMIPGGEDLKALLTPEDIAFIESGRK